MSDSQIAPWRETLWEQLRNVNPEDICPRAVVEFNKDGFYSVNFMDNEYRVYSNDENIEGPEGDSLASYPKFELLLLSYLVGAMNIPLTGNWVSEKDLPGGSIFFQGPHRLPDSALIKNYGKNATQFLEIGEKLGGKKLEYGDASFEFRVLPRISIGCVLWVEDEEFPARVNYLFDSSIAHHLALDVVYALIKSFVRKFLEFY